MHPKNSKYAIPYIRAPASLSSDEKQALLDNLDLEVQDRQRKLRTTKDHLSAYLNFWGDLELNKIPKAIRALTMKEFTETYHCNAKEFFDRQAALEVEKYSLPAAPDVSKKGRKRLRGNQAKEDSKKHKRNLTDPDTKSAAPTRTLRSRLKEQSDENPKRKMSLAQRATRSQRLVQRKSVRLSTYSRGNGAPSKDDPEEKRIPQTEFNFNPPLIQVPLSSGEVLELDPAQSPSTVKNLDDAAKKKLYSSISTLQSQLNRFMSAMN
ncbi:hypothetical protein K493DRAFT_311642 [Basidiobolus meristosporus CBS 931.73]|uniref:Borealin N-terminal domain-containing protein n=1 Tax=Basidiobolus meristosporus CBS 931.73 TaxID=1314790 RepID=A0A1Y1Z0Y7_9FUNG|nr:hypothetical protein K493DRAFT_311642 [Basidiobolus meristosporus CBS 931.73]|eukprot:ORY03607.1 hypothetical protein K493DRAFT_311642 [Basidiobolus meristosporus CBS 931.73]